MEPTKPNIAEQAAKALGLSELAPELYRDLLQPTARELGQHFLLVAKAVGVALTPLQGAVWGFERIRDYISVAVARRLGGKPAEHIKSPDLVIAGPVIMGLAFAAEAPHLREMYANLLAAAMHGPSANRAHPSFVHTIQQLSSGEAWILNEIARSHAAGDVLFTEKFRDGTLPVKGTKFIYAEWRDLCAKCGTGEEVLADAYYHNLVRLGILVEGSEVEAEYHPAGGNDRGTWEGSVTSKTTHVVTLSHYGDLFLDVCVRDN